MDMEVKVTPSIEALLAPRNVALVGASDRPGHWSERVWQNLARFDFEGPVYPVNPNRSAIWGVRCYPDLASLPEPPDHLAIFVPAEVTIDVLEKGAAMGARSASLFAAGFGEGGEVEGRALARRLKEVLSRTRIAAVGPNCMGLASGRSRLVTIPDETLEILKPGPIAVLTQSGAMCATINRALNDRNLAVGHMISCGNQVGLTFGDYIDFLADDPDLKVILCYIEGIPDAPRFLSAVARARACSKQVITVKIGGSEASRAAALSHTGSLAGTLEVFDAFVTELGAIRVDGLEEAVEAAEFLVRACMPKGPNVAFMTISGAVKSIITDAVAVHGLRLAGLRPETEARLREALGENADVENPLDTKRTLPTEQYMACIKTLALADEVDLLLIAEELPREAGIERKVKNLKALEAWLGRKDDSISAKPVAMFSPIALRETDYMLGLRKEIEHIPLLCDLGKTCRVAAALVRASRCAVAVTPELADAAPPSPIQHRELLRGAEQPKALNEVESKKLLAAYGIPIPPEEVVSTVDEALVAAHKIGYPLVVKGVSAAVPHKSDAGLVILDVADESGLRSAVNTLTRRCADLNAPLEGILVAKQVSDGIEAILGVYRDPEMGPAIMVGMGGVWLELFRDVAFAPPHLDRSRALAAIGRTRMSKLLAGYRGKQPGDILALADAMVALGKLARELGDSIESVDINPLLIQETGVYALDGLVVMRSREGRSERK